MCSSNSKRPVTNVTLYIVYTKNKQSTPVHIGRRAVPTSKSEAQARSTHMSRPTPYLRYMQEAPFLNAHNQTTTHTTAPHTHTLAPLS